MGSCFIRFSIPILIAFFLQGCGGGGGGSGGGGETSGTTTPTPTTPATPNSIVTGSVQAPGGQVALLERDQWATKLASMFISSSYADLIGMAIVPDGTVVELVRVDPFTGAAAGAPLATTSVSAGRYSFDLTSLGLDYSPTLLVRLASSTGIQMRSFLTGAVTNLDPNSEASVQLILESIAAKTGSSLALMTVKDLDDIVASMDMLISASGLAAGSTTAATVNFIKAKLSASSELSALLNTKLTAGHADTGPGDLANYFPLSSGDTWTYSVSTNGATPTSAEVRAVGVATLRNGAMVIPISLSTTTFPLPGPGGEAPVFKHNDFYLKDTSGLVSYGGSTDPAGVTALAPSYQELKLPAKVGDTLVAVDKTGNFDLGKDLDGDGIPETLTRYKLDKLVAPYQNIGALRCMVVENHFLIALTLSASKMTVVFTSIDKWYLASGVGIVRTVEIDNWARSDGVEGPETVTQRDLIDATIGGVNVFNQPPPGTVVKTLSLDHNDLIYDKTRNRLYASVPGSIVNGNSIAVVNPDTGTIMQTIPVGSEPLRLALSKGDEYLYVGLDGSGEIARINLATLTPDLKFSLGIRPVPWLDQLFVGDIAVLPNNPLSIVVSEKTKGTSPSFVGLAVFDGAVRRPNKFQGFGVFANAIAISDDAASVYGIDYETSLFELSRFSIAPTGISFLDQTNGLAGNYATTRIQFYGGRLYLTNGRVIDPVNKVLAGVYQPGGPTWSLVTSCIPDSLSARTYCLDGTIEANKTLTLISFNQALFTQLAKVDTHIPVDTFGIGPLVRFGTKGFAIGARTSGFSGPFDKIHLISSDIAL